MDMQYKIKLMAEQQGQAMKELRDFIDGQKAKDITASKAAKEFDASKVVLPGIRGSQDPKQDAEYRKQAANQLFKEKKYKEALQVYREILQTYADVDASFVASIHFNVALCEQKTGGKDTEVLESLCQAVKLNPQYEKAHIQRARVYMRQKRWQDALDDFYASGREQDAIQAEIQTCIQNLPGQRIEFDESTSESSQPENQPDSVSTKQSADEVPYEANYTIAEGDVGQFYTKVREFERYPRNLGEFLGQFHSSVLGQYIEALEGRLTVVELEAVVQAVLGGNGGFSAAKQINILYQILQVGRFRGDLQFASDTVLGLINGFIAAAGGADLTDVQRDRLDVIRTTFAAQ